MVARREPLPSTFGEAGLHAAERLPHRVFVQAGRRHGGFALELRIEAIRRQQRLPGDCT